MRVLGVDPGTAVTGYGVVDSATVGFGRLIECGVVRTRPVDPLPMRLQQIYDGLSEVLERLAPDVMAVEGIFYATNVRTTVVLGHARGVVLLAGAQHGLPVMEYSPAQIKKAVVGRGAAVKPQVGYMVARLLKLKTAPTPADAADGVAVALTHLLMGGARKGRRTAS
ncbi:MAG: crossover junction endodeoxyribonuclease RuvC [Gemmatimonadota bacterium]